MTLDAAGLDLLFREARTPQQIHRPAGHRRRAAGAVRRPEDGSDLGQLLAGALPVPAHQGGEAEAGAGAVERATWRRRWPRR